MAMKRKPGSPVPCTACGLGMAGATATRFAAAPGKCDSRSGSVGPLKSKPTLLIHIARPATNATGLRLLGATAVGSAEASIAFSDWKRRGAFERVLASECLIKSALNN